MTKLTIYEPTGSVFTVHNVKKTKWLREAEKNEGQAFKMKENTNKKIIIYFFFYFIRIRRIFLV